MALTIFIACMSTLIAGLMWAAVDVACDFRTAHRALRGG